MGVLKIAVVQQNGNPNKPNENREKALDFAKEAIKNDADIILFHEELLLGYCENVENLSEPEDGETSQAFIRLLSETGSDACIVYGLTEKCGDKFYISAPVVTKNGIIANYRKTHLWWAAEGLRDEKKRFSPGERLGVFEHKSAKIGIMICYDGDFYEMARSYADLDCSLLLWLNNRTSRGHDDRVEEQASINSMNFAVSCCCGEDETGRHCGGGSNITAYDGGLLSEIWDKEGIIYAEVNGNEALHDRQFNPWYMGRRNDLYIQT